MSSMLSVNGDVEEESFVILDSSPLSSLNSNIDTLKGQSNMVLSVNSNMESVLQQDNIDESEISVKMVKSNENKSAQSTPDASIVDASILKEQMSASQKSAAYSSLKSSSLQGNGTVYPSSLAASFIMGEVDADTLKASIYTQFPSICSTSHCEEDLNKLESFYKLYMQLKNALAKANNTMKLFYDKWNTEHEARLKKEEFYEKQLQTLQSQIAILRNENLDLHRDLDAKVEQLQISLKHREKEHTGLIQQISEKKAQMENMRIHIEKLEQQQLASFEFMPKNENDSKEKPDYVCRNEHERIVKGFEHQLSDLLAQNLDLKDVQTQYIDELTCLKVNCTAGEELVKQLRADISLLKTKDIEKSDIFNNYEMERNNMRDEIAILRQQVEVYSKDFDIERQARQNLAGEKDQLLQDLRNIQRKNQELIEQAQKRLEQSATTSIKAGVSRESYVGNEQRPVRQPLPSPSQGVATVNNYCCPICYKSFEKVDVLEHHVNLCLKDD